MRTRGMAADRLVPTFPLLSFCPAAFKSTVRLAWVETCSIRQQQSVLICILPLKGRASCAYLQLVCTLCILRRPFHSHRLHPTCATHLQEPWLLEYLSLDMPSAMTAAGFLPPRQLENSPRHKTVVAVKPQQ